MSWEIGFNENQNRDVGYSVTAICDHPGCTAEIDRGLGYVCCEDINHRACCGAFLCADHRENYTYADELEDMEPEELEELGHDLDDPETQLLIAEGDIVKCNHKAIEYKEHAGWLNHCLTHETWAKWREENPALVAAYKDALKRKNGNVCFVVKPLLKQVVDVAEPVPVPEFEPEPAPLLENPVGLDEPEKDLFE